MRGQWQNKLFDLKYHCAYHPASGGTVERENGTLKTSWPNGQMRARVRPKYGVSPYGVLFGRPPNTGIGPVKRPLPTTDKCEDEILRYCISLSRSLSQVHAQVKEALPNAATGQIHDLQPGDWVVDIKRKSWRQARWAGPYQILLTTQTAIKVPGRQTWVHVHHCKMAPAPPPSEDQEKKQMIKNDAP